MATMQGSLNPLYSTMSKEKIMSNLLQTCNCKYLKHVLFRTTRQQCICYCEKQLQPALQHSCYINQFSYVILYHIRIKKDRESNGESNVWCKTDGEKKRTEDLMEMLGLKETVVQVAKANGMRWYGHVLRRADGHILRKAMEFEVRGKRQRGRPKKTWKTQVGRRLLLG